MDFYSRANAARVAEEAKSGTPLPAERTPCCRTPRQSVLLQLGGPGPGPGSDPQKSRGERFFWPVQVAVQVGVARRQAHAMPDPHNSNAGAHSFRPSQANLLLRG